MPHEPLAIGQLARATGTKVETIRFYEKTGLLPAPARTEGNYRAYTSEHPGRLRCFSHAMPARTMSCNPMPTAL